MKTKLSRCTAAQKITAYYNIYKTDSPRSYTVTKTCLVFPIIKRLWEFNSKIATTSLDDICATSSK